MPRRIIRRRPIRRRENFGQTTGKGLTDCQNACSGEVCSDGTSWTCKDAAGKVQCPGMGFANCAAAGLEGFRNVRRPCRVARRREGFGNVRREGFGQTAPSSSCCPCGPGGGRGGGMGGGRGGGSNGGMGGGGMGGGGMGGGGMGGGGMGGGGMGGGGMGGGGMGGGVECPSAEANGRRSP